MTPRRRTTDRQPSRESQLESQRNLLDEQVHFLKQEIAQLHRVIESLQKSLQDTAYGELV